MSSWTIKTGNAALTESNVFTGTNTFQGTTILTGPVNVSGLATFDGVVVVNGSATFTSAVSFTGPSIKEKRTSVSVSATYALNPANGHYFDIVLVDNCTITASATLTATQEQEIFIKVIQDATGGRSLTWSGVTWETGVAPTMPQAAAAILSVTLVVTSSEIRGFYALTSSDSITLTDITSTGTNSTAAVKRRTRVVTVSGAVTVTALDHIVIVNKAFAEATTVNFPAGASGQEFVVKDGSGTAGTTNPITVSAGAIDSSSTAVISNNWGALTFVYNGAKFNVI